MGKIDYTRMTQPPQCFWCGGYGEVKHLLVSPTEKKPACLSCYGMMTAHLKKCAWCGDFIDHPLFEDIKQRLRIDAKEEGSRIYLAIVKDHKFRSIDLCNRDYTLLRLYRITQ